MICKQNQRIASKGSKAQHPAKEVIHSLVFIAGGKDTAKSSRTLWSMHPHNSLADNLFHVFQRFFSVPTPKQSWKIREVASAAEKALELTDELVTAPVYKKAILPQADSYGNYI